MFKSKWIAPHEVRENMHICFKKQCTLGAFKTAVLRITADDYYKLYINGRYVGEGPAPSYPFRYSFNEYDVADCLRRGNNEIEVRVYYQGLVNRVWVSGDSRVGMIADLTVDGQYLTGTNSSWQYRTDSTFTGGSKLGYDTAFTENRDFTAPQNEYLNARETECDYTFDSAPFTPVCVHTVGAKGEGAYYDFGREYVGCPVIKATAKADGAALVIRCGEELDEGGRVRFDMRCGCRYEEKCILKKGENLIEQYDYKALRYMEIEADENVTVNEVKLAVRHYPFGEKTPEIRTGNPHLKAVFDLCKSTVLYGTQDVFVDCPTREKGQYLGDAYISGFAHFYLTKDGKMLKKALYDFADTVRFSGQFLSVAPCAYRQKIADYDLLYPHMLFKYYNLTKDAKTLQELAPVCEHILAEYSVFANADGLLENVTNAWNLVDWHAEMRDGYQYRTDGDGEYGLHSVINAYYIFAVRCAEQICGILNREFKPKSSALIDSFNRTFLCEKTGLYLDCKGGGHSSLHANILPLAFGVCGAENRAKPLEFLLNKGMCCSVFMAYFYLKALCVNGRKDKALELITSDGEHSWRNMLGEGATTTFEAWGKEQKWNTSLFHPWAVAPVLILGEHFGQMVE